MWQGTFSPHRTLSEAGDWSCTPTTLLHFFSGMPDPLKKQEVLPFQLFLSLPAFKSSCKSLWPYALMKMSSHSFILILWDCLTTLELKYSQHYPEKTIIWEANWHCNKDEIWRWKSVWFFKVLQGFWMKSEPKTSGGKQYVSTQEDEESICGPNSPPWLRVHAMTNTAEACGRYEKVLEEEWDSCMRERQAGLGH